MTALGIGDFLFLSLSAARNWQLHHGSRAGQARGLGCLPAGIVVGSTILVTAPTD